MDSKKQETKKQEKEYNKLYYAKNKAKILAQMCTKEKCKICNKQVNHQHMVRHQRSALCQAYKLILERDAQLQKELNKNFN